MNFISDFSKNVTLIEYGWDKPQSAVVLVPGISFLVQKIQTDHLLEQMKSESAVTEEEVYNQPYNKTFNTMLIWHGLGAVIHTIATAIFAKFFSFIFVPVAIIGAFQVYKSFMDYKYPEFKYERDQFSRIK